MSMKKRFYFNIFVSATALMGAMVFTSCGQDDVYSETNAERIANDKYAAAFEKAFGKVGSNVDWGFSSKNSSTRAFTRAGGEVFEPTITFPDDCDDSKFLEEVPTGVSKLPTWGGGAGNYYIDETTTEVETWSGKSNIYVTGTVDLSADDTNAQSFKFRPDMNSEIYLLKGATLKLGEQSAINFNVAAIYIAPGAKLETAGLLKANTATKVYNHGTVSVGTFEVNTSSFLYNVGTLTAESVNAESNNSRIVNGGSIESESVVVNAGAVYNYFEWTVSGTTYVNSNNSGWINNGQWTTNDYTYVAGSKNVINNCHLKVNHEFYINLSSLSANNDADMGFKINSGGSVETEYFIGGRHLTEYNEITGGPFRIYMAENSLFKVTYTATLESSRGPKDEEVGFGFFGPSEGGYAVFQAKDIVRDPYLEGIKSHGAVTYGDNLYVSAETHFAQGYDSDGSGNYAGKPFIFEQGSFSIANNIYAGGFKSGKPNITIEETPCCPGFYGGDPLYRVIAEDLSASEAGDFDFNDVVFDVVKAEDGKTTLKLICAGGVLPLRVRGANESEGTEIHSVFGQSEPNAKGEYSMFNTGAGLTAPEAEFTVNGEYTTPEQIKNIIIEVNKNGTWMELRATTGEAACKILVDDSFKPVEERQNIADANGNFTDYVQGNFVDDFWWK